MQENNISVNNLEQCLKCNICTTVCPMMAVNPHYPGPKQAGPDSERYRLKDPAYFDLTLKYCLNCKRCEVACPSGVKVGDIIQIARLKYGKVSKPLRDTMLASTDLVGSLASPFAKIVNPAVGLEPVKKVMDAVVGIDKHRTFPSYSPQKFVNWFKRYAAKNQSEYKRSVSYFHGCYVNYNYPQLGKAFVKILNACGYGVNLLDGEKCCGVALLANGLGRQAMKQAKRNVKAIRKAAQTVLTTSSTCTFTMRDEYEHVLGLDCADIRDNLCLATKWLYEMVEAGKLKLAFRKDYKKRIVYHTPCHMQKLGWEVFSTSLLKMIPGVTLKVPEQECCGISGTFGFKKEYYDYSMKIGSKLFENLRLSNCELVATDCETCKWQIEMGTGYTVMNPIEIIAEALDIEETSKLNAQ